ncbi:MAG: hypothetical protein K8W52_36830 [Deltaproteobacteria bacterium]|nr:hypothetical protein [Deltaproteobacteria bacterium]
MWIREEIAAAVSTLGARAMELADDAALAVERRAELDFATPGHRPLWERLLNVESIHDANAWRCIEALVLGPATLLVRDAQGLCAVRFERGPDLVAAIGECSGFTFYVLDDANHFLLAFNDHDVLIGCGAAAEWVGRLRSREV